MKNIIFLVVLLFLSVAPAGSIEEEPYLAVFCQEDFSKSWKFDKPDLLMGSRKWNDFKLFVRQIERLSKERKVVVVVDCHGKRNGYLWIGNDKTHNGEDSDIGYLVSQLDTLPEGKVKALCIEACFAGYVYHNSFHEGRESCKVRYPIYGDRNTTNFGHSIYWQFISGERVDFNDLRIYDPHGEDPGAPQKEGNITETATQYFNETFFLRRILSGLTTTK